MSATFLISYLFAALNITERPPFPASHDTCILSFPKMPVCSRDIVSAFSVLFLSQPDRVRSYTARVSSSHHEYWRCRAAPAAGCYRSGTTRLVVVGGGGGGGVKGWWHAARALYLHRRNVLFLLRRTKIFFERSKNNIDLH